MDVRAIHEAGHVVVALVLGVQVQTVTLASTVTLVRRNPDAAERHRQCVIAMAGPAAEDRYQPTTPDQRALLWAGAGWAGDLANAARWQPIAALRQVELNRASGWLRGTGPPSSQSRLRCRSRRS